MQIMVDNEQHSQSKAIDKLSMKINIFINGIVY